MGDRGRTEPGLLRSLITGSSSALLTCAFAYAAPLPLLGAAFTVTPPGMALGLGLGVYAGVTHRRRRRRREAAKAKAAADVVASRGGPDSVGPAADAAAEALVRSLADEFAERHAQPSLTGFGEPLHQSVDVLWALARRPTGAIGARDALSGGARSLLPILSYLGARLGNAIWDVSSRRGEFSPSSVLSRAKRRVSVDRRVAATPTSLAIHPLEMIAAPLLLDLIPVGGWVPDVERIGAGAPLLVHRAVHASANQLWQAVLVLAAASGAFADAEPRERLARSLCHVIAAGSILAPYTLLAKAPPHAAWSALNGFLRALIGRDDRADSDRPSLWQLQVVSTLAASLLTVLVSEALEATELAEHRYVMRRLAELRSAS